MAEVVIASPVRASDSRLPGVADTTRMDDQELRPQLDKVRILESARGGTKMDLEQLQQGVIADVPSSHDEQLPRRTLQEMPVAKVAILRDHHPILRVRHLHNLGVSGRVTVREVAGVDGLMTSMVQQKGEPRGQLGIDQELHALPSGMSGCPPAVNAPNSNAARRSSRSRSG